MAENIFNKKNPTNKIIYAKHKFLPTKSLDSLVASVGWDQRGEKAWNKIIRKSSLIITAWHKNDIVGLGRTLEDGTMCMIYDIVVNPEYQGQKIGTCIMNCICSEIKKKNYISVGLFAWDKNPINIKFYEKFNFKTVNFGMKLSKNN